MRRMICILVFLSVAMSTAQATVVNGRFYVATNDGSTYAIKVELKANASAGLGGCTLQFTYNTSSLSYPSFPVSGTNYTFAAFSGGNYSAGTVTQPTNGTLSVNVEYNGSDGGGTAVDTSWTEVATITFTTLDVAGASNLIWVVTEVIDDDGLTQWTNGTFTNINTSPLPIQLKSFAVGTVSANQVVLRWETASEIDNYGFKVQRSTESTSGFETLEDSFREGHGTTDTSNTYSYSDQSPLSGTSYYRLVIIDRSRDSTFSEAVQAVVAGTASGVATVSAIPASYQLDQNYPNPFNPSTKIVFALPKTSNVSLKVYNVLGQEVANLAEGTMTAGYHTVTFDAHALASGLYFYRISAGDFTSLRKMVLLK